MHVCLPSATVYMYKFLTKYWHISELERMQLEASHLNSSLPFVIPENIAGIPADIVNQSTLPKRIINNASYLAQRYVCQNLYQREMVL